LPLRDILTDGWMDGQGDSYIPLKLCVWVSIMTNLEMEYVKR